MRPSSRYSSFDSQFSDPSSSSSLKQRFTNENISRHPSHALIKTKSKTNQDQNLSSMVKKLMKPKANNKTGRGLFIPADIIAEDMKKSGVGNKVSSFSRKLFHKGGKEKSEVKALSEVKANTRTLAMVLRSERELLNLNKEYENDIAEIKFILEQKNREVEKLKDLCLKQREEIKELKSAILFPDVMNSQLQGLLQKQGSELDQAKQVIPTLQRQVTSLTGQLQCLADDLAEVKADKVAGRPYFYDQVNSPEATISSEFSLGDPTAPESPDDMFLKDFNPCLTPYSTKTRSKEFDEIRGYYSPDEAGLVGSSSNVRSTNYSQARKTSKSSDYRQMAFKGSTTSRTFRWSNENMHKDGKPPQGILF